jgi:hypothetical protein
MKRVLKSPQKFLLTSAPGWKDVTLYELNLLLATPWTSYKTIPFVSPDPLASAQSSILVGNCTYRQMMELSMRLLTIHDVDWIVFSKRCVNRSELFSHLKFLSFDQIFSPTGHYPDSQSTPDHDQTISTLQSPVKVISYANKSFVNSSSLLKDYFYKLHPSLVDSSPQTDSHQLVNRIKISLIENILTVTLSLGGNDLPLWKRGYKFQSFDNSSVADQDSEKRLAIAPLAEHHAAACFLWMLSSNYREMFPISDSSTSPPVLHYQSILKNIQRIIIPFAGSGKCYSSPVTLALPPPPSLTSKAV